MAEFDADPDEIVNVGSHPMTLRSAVRLYVSKRPEGLIPPSVFREHGKVPEVLGAEELDQLAELDDFK